VKFGKAKRILTQSKEGPGPCAYRVNTESSAERKQHPRSAIGRQSRKIDVIRFGSKNSELILKGIV
jgi:hypothetical protein